MINASASHCSSGSTKPARTHSDRSAADKSISINSRRAKAAGLIKRLFCIEQEDYDRDVKLVAKELDATKDHLTQYRICLGGD